MGIGDLRVEGVGILGISKHERTCRKDEKKDEEMDIPDKFGCKRVEYTFQE